MTRVKDTTFRLEDLITTAKRRENVVKSVRHLQLRIPKDEIIVVGGAAMQMFGMKVSPDIDLVTAPERMTKLLKSIEHGNTKLRSLGHIGLMVQVIDHTAGQKTYEEDGGIYVGVTVGNVTFMPAPNDHLYQASFEELHDEAIEIDGVLVSPVERRLAWKQAVGRPKDLRDINLINEYALSYNIFDHISEFGG